MALLLSTSSAHAQSDSAVDVPGIYTPQGSPFALLNAPDASPQPTTAQQTFDAAFRRVQSYPVPPYAVWTSTWHITRRPMGYYTGETKSVEVNRYALRLADGMENVSDPIPSGKLPPAIIEPEFLGPFAWTIRSSVRVAPPQSVTMSPDIAGLMTIAHVVSVAKWPYSLEGDAASLRVEVIDGHQTYHFQLKPRDDPQKHNLR